MTSRRFSPLGFALLACLLIASRPVSAGDVLFQASTIEALLGGVMDGDMTFGELGKHGDFGLGTVNALDGEMVALDGVFYQVTADGKVAPIPDGEMTPFADVVRFAPDQVALLEAPADLAGVAKLLDASLPSANLFYAAKVRAFFPKITVRSVPRQKAPYPPLAEAVKNQSVFTFENLPGTLIGVRMPAGVGGLGVPGWHFHFLSEDKTKGGHVLDCLAQGAKAEIDVLDSYAVVLPRTPDFLAWKRPAEAVKDLGAVEKK